MDNGYFDFLKNAAEDKVTKEQEVTSSSHNKNQAILVIKVDIDAQIYCDGDFMELVGANVVNKIPIPIGQHILTIVSERVSDLSIDREIDIIEGGKSYLIIVNELSIKEQEFITREQEKKSLELKQKELAETDFISRYYDLSIHDLKAECYTASWFDVLNTIITPSYFNLGNPSAAFIFSQTIIKRKLYNGDGSAEEALRFAADKGIAEAQYQYGLLLHEQSWVSDGHCLTCEDEAKEDLAIHYLKLSTQQGHIDACKKLGNIIWDPEESFFWFLEAIKLGDIEAADAAIATWYQDWYQDHPNSVDPSEMIPLLETAACNKNARAMYYLADIYSEELFSDYYDLEKAESLYRQAASLGDKDAQSMLDCKFPN